jgi:hypothetical protein
MMLQILVICNYLIIFDNIKLFIIFDFGCWVWSVDILSYMLTHIFRYGNLSKSLTDVVADSSPRAFVPKRHFLVRIFLKIIVQQDSVWLLREKQMRTILGLENLVCLVDYERRLLLNLTVRLGLMNVNIPTRGINRWV